MLSLHTSPLAQPGTGDGGGMNVYVRELSTALARAGVECDVYTRAWSDDLPATVTWSRASGSTTCRPGRRAPWPKRSSPRWSRSSPTTSSRRMQGAEVVGPGAETRLRRRACQLLAVRRGRPPIKHQLDLPLVSTFHTLDRVKAEASPEEVERRAPPAGRGRSRHHALLRRGPGLVLGGGHADLRALRRRPARIRVVAPGVDHAFFGPGHRPQARRALGLPERGPLLLFVGRIQPLKGCRVAVRALAALGPTARRPTSWWSVGRAARRGEELERLARVRG